MQINSPKQTLIALNRPFGNAKTCTAGIGLNRAIHITGAAKFQLENIFSTLPLDLQTDGMRQAIKYWGDEVYLILSGSNCAVDNAEDETMSTGSDVSLVTDDWALPPLIQRRGRGKCGGEAVERRANHASVMNDQQRSNSFAFSATLGSAHKLIFAKPTVVVIDEAARVDILSSAVLAGLEHVRTTWIVGGQQTFFNKLWKIDIVYLQILSNCRPLCSLQVSAPSLYSIMYPRSSLYSTRGIQMEKVRLINTTISQTASGATLRSPNSLLVSTMPAQSAALALVPVLLATTCFRLPRSSMSNQLIRISSHILEVRSVRPKFSKYWSHFCESLKGLPSSFWYTSKTSKLSDTHLCLFLSGSVGAS